MSDIYGLEHKGMIVISKNKHHNIDELWYIAKNIEHNVDHEELRYLAKAWSNAKSLSCSYPTDIMDKIESFEKSLYFQFD